MTILPITPASHSLSAAVRVPGSKSLTNRALALAALADGPTALTNALLSDDSLFFANALRQLGFTIESPSDSSFITHRSSFRMQGLGGRIPSSHASLFTGNAGTAARFLTAFVTLGHGEYIIDGNDRMRQRPIGDLVSALNALGANVSPLNPQSTISNQQSVCPPVRVIASGLPGGTARISGETSSQFISALLMIAPYAQSPVELIVERRLNSKPYVDMTIAVMNDFGVAVERDGYERFCVTPQRYRAQSEYIIESDATAASYFFAAPAICGGSVRVQNISRRSKQGDIAFLDVLEQMGCKITAGGSPKSPPSANVIDVRLQNTEVWIEVTGPDQLRGVDVDLRDIPDTAQTLAAIAPFADSPTTIRGIASARLKETDRIAAACAELRRLGVAVEEYPDGLKIYRCENIRPAVIQTYDDHRMAMAFALVGLRAPGIAIENPTCVSKTFPNYFEVLEELRRG